MQYSIRYRRRLTRPPQLAPVPVAPAPLAPSVVKPMVITESVRVRRPTSDPALSPDAR